ncbi:GNAT family N-acetyltransferase [Halorarius litoreus]|uniref:GNAT family N-acetyltransferase n=1 Tax=Halorarius litoreus TaxID=2962676 RepID=UPI0020CCC6F2|nr:GNAT family N-acetyltransferase [Halorarius litoreus]
MLRLATTDNAAAIRDIYAPYVRETSITFEESVPTESEIRDRIDAKRPTFPWFVCELDDSVVGYAYAGELRSRAAYRWVVETSVYVDESAEGRGVGRALYSVLLACLERQGFADAYAVITVPNPRSIDFHDRMGFERATRFPEMGYKQGAWYDVEWWRRSLAERRSPPAAPRAVDEVRGDDWWASAIERAESRLDG